MPLNSDENSVLDVLEVMASDTKISYIFSQSDIHVIFLRIEVRINYLYKIEIVVEEAGRGQNYVKVIRLARVG